MPQFICKKCRSTKPERGRCPDCGCREHFAPVETADEVEAALAERAGRYSPKSRPATEAQTGPVEMQPGDILAGATEFPLVHGPRADIELDAAAKPDKPPVVQAVPPGDYQV